MFTVFRLNSLSIPFFRQHVEISRPWNRMFTIGGKVCCENNPSRPKGVKKHSSPSRAITLLVALPLILITTGVQWISTNAEKTEGEQRPEFAPYPYLRIRTKKFPWGDGNKSLFHNPKMNALPDGYEEDLEPTND